MKRILLITEHFYPSNAIGAVRPTKIAKYLTGKGYIVDVVTNNAVFDDKNSELFHNIYTFDVQSDDDIRKSTPLLVSSHKSHSTFYKKLYFVYSSINNIIDAKITTAKFKNLIKSQFGKNDYDAVISTYGPLSSIPCGLTYKKLYPNVKWICDFRDPIVVDVVPKLFYPYYKYLQNKACKKADVITTVSNGYFDRICKDKFVHKSYMIPNGYDKDDMPILSEKNDSGKLTFAYAGILYSGKRDMSPLFKAFRELADENIIDKSKLLFQYAGGNGDILCEQAKKYGMEDIIIDNGQIPRDECLKLQFSSDFLVLATWNYKGETGVFPGKILEYMLMEKPIISLTNGNIPNGEVTEVIRKANLGIAYEEANTKADFEALKNYIKKQYDVFIETGNTDFSPQKQVIDKYDWDNLIKKFIEFI